MSTELLSQQKNDLMDIIGFLEISLKDHPESHTESWITSLDGLLTMIDARIDAHERKWIDPEDLWDRHSFALDDRRTVVASVKAMLGDQGFKPEEPCPELRINRQSWDNIIEGIEHDEDGNVWADDLLEYLAYYIEHAPAEVRL
jgi:hypothetical protein